MATSVTLRWFGTEVRDSRRLLGGDDDALHPPSDRRCPRTVGVQEPSVGKVEHGSEQSGRFRQRGRRWRRPGWHVVIVACGDHAGQDAIGAGASADLVPAMRRSDPEMGDVARLAGQDCGFVHDTVV